MDVMFDSAFAPLSVAVSKTNGTEKCKPNESYLVSTAKIYDISENINAPNKNSFFIKKPPKILIFLLSDFLLFTKAAQWAVRIT